MATLPMPFELVFGGLRHRFDAVQRGLEASGPQADDRDRFLLQREVAELLRELRPETGLGAEVEMLGALVHHAYRFWRAGERVRVVTREAMVAMMGRDSGLGNRESAPATSPPSPESRIPSPAHYVQLPALAVWARLESGPPEPLDGWFAARVRFDELEVLAILGMYPGRPGFTAVEVRGSRPEEVARADGSPQFAPIAADAGAQAGLASVRDAGELLALAFGVEDLP